MVTTSTSTTAGARDHARAQEGTVVASSPTLPAPAWPTPPEGVNATDLVWAEQVAGGGYAHKVLARGTTVRLRDLEGDACANLLLYNADQPFERLNVADTVKVQWQVYSTTGQLLLSDQGRVLASVVDDTSLHHDTIFGTSSRASNTERYGAGGPQDASPAGRELFTLAAAKHGLGRRDLPPSISFFKGIRVDDHGAPQFTGAALRQDQGTEAAQGTGGSSITLRMELPVIILIANTAHPLDPRPDYHCTPLEVLAWRGRATCPEDRLWHASPEGRRAFTNTHDYLTARGLA